MHPPKISGPRYGMKLKFPVMPTSWSHGWCAFDVIKIRNDVIIQLQLPREKFSLISYLEPVLFVHNFWPLNLD